MITSIESDASGKAFPEGRSGTIQIYYNRIIDTLSAYTKKGEMIYIVGPGSSKNALSNLIRSRDADMGKMTVVVEGVDVAGEDGVRMALKTPMLQELLRDSKLVRAALLVREALTRISRGDERVAVGLLEAARAVEAGAIDALLVSDRAFAEQEREEMLVQILNRVEAARGQVYLIDSSTEVGLQVSALCGLVGLLRFPLPA